MKAAPPSSIESKLTHLSHALGREDHALAILGEGNTSARTGSETFWVKSSGSNLATLTNESLTECHLSPLVALLDAPNLSDDEIDQALLDSRVDSTARKPSVEAIFHAWLLALPDVNFIGHTHPVAVNALLCSPQASDFANRRLFPDQIVCCGAKSVRVPYCDPGLILAQAIRSAVVLHREQTGTMPRLILLENHGMIALGASPEAVLATTLMAEKAARITLGALSAGGPHYLTSENVNRIASRTDEHYRQKALGL